MLSRELFGVQRAFHIFAHDLAALAGAGERCDVQPCAGGHNSGQGRNLDLAYGIEAGAHVTFENAPFGAAAGHAGNIHIKFARQPPRGGRGEGPPA